MTSRCAQVVIGRIVDSKGPCSASCTRSLEAQGTLACSHRDLLQVVLASGESLHCQLPQDLQGQLLFKGSGFFIVAPVTTAQSKSNSSLPPSSASKSAEPQHQQSFLDSSAHLSQSNEAKQGTTPADSQANVEPGWQVVYVLADADLPELARQGLW